MLCKITSVCESYKLITDGSGEISSHQGAGALPYIRGMSCKWQFVGKPGIQISANLIYLNLTSNSDSIALYEGSDDTELVTIQGGATTWPTKFLSVSNILTVVFTTGNAAGSSNKGLGFRLQYSVGNSVEAATTSSKQTSSSTARAVVSSPSSPATAKIVSDTSSALESTTTGKLSQTGRQFISNNFCLRSLQYGKCHDGLLVANVLEISTEPATTSSKQTSSSTARTVVSSSSSPATTKIVSDTSSAPESTTTGKRSQTEPTATSSKQTSATTARAVVSSPSSPATAKIVSDTSSAPESAATGELTDSNQFKADVSNHSARCCQQPKFASNCKNCIRYQLCSGVGSNWRTVTNGTDSNQFKADVSNHSARCCQQPKFASNCKNCIRYQLCSGVDNNWQTVTNGAAPVHMHLGQRCAAVTKKNGADCKANTCKNGGTCNTFTPSPPCICVLPYIAPNCATAADYCKTLQPDKNITALPVCQNGGACTLTYTDPFFNCTCPPKFYGIRCQFRVTTSAPTTIERTTETYQDATSSRYSDGINATLMPSTKSPGPVDSNPFDSLLVKSLAIGIPSAIVLALIIAGVIALIVKCRNCGKGSGSRYV
uniref:CUB domain-containing protein n=1 Tax=Macrostomum lignano TaxID=282301 RepID=A0A1I8GDZ8_9PLAT